MRRRLAPVPEVPVQTPARPKRSGLRARPEETGALRHAGPAFAFPLQTKAVVGAADSQYEREADAVAARVVAGEPAPAVSRLAPGALAQRQPEEEAEVQRMCAGCEEEEAVQRQVEDGEEEEQVQAKRAGPTSTAATAAVRSPGPGARMHPPTRQRLEASLGADLSGVRVHDDARAHGHAADLGARAFAHGHRIWLGRGESQADVRLMAHETAHVLQQGGASTSATGRRSVVQRQPYSTRGIALDRATLGNLAPHSYWEQRTFRAYTTTVDARMQADAEERDAVLAAVWSAHPSTRVTATEVLLIPVAARAQPGGSRAPELLYRATFTPAASGATLPALALQFVASGAPSVPRTLPAAPAAFSPATPAAGDADGFPAGRDAYWAAHPDEHRAVFQFVQTVAPDSFDQVVTAETRNGAGRVTHAGTMRLSGAHEGNTVSRLDITFLHEGGAADQQTPPADYRERDMASLELERLQAAAGAANRLGAVTLPAGLSADERLAVRVAIWQYFEAGSARNTEADVIVPVGATGSRTVLYTLTFGAGNDVVATRIGVAGTATAQVDVNRLDVQRVRGFPGASATPAQLRTWWGARYPHGGALPAQTAPDVPDASALITAMNGLLATGVTANAWFDQHYGLEVLDAAPAATRLQAAHSVPAEMTTDTTNFTRQDLRMLELSLQTLGTSEIGLLRGVKLIRKTAAIRRSGGTYAAGNAGQYGLTLKDGAERSVLYFEPLYMNNDALFRGGSAATALPDVTMGILHELGHAAGHQQGVEAAFNTWLAAHPQAAPTWYAASAGSERFPEFYALFHTDPIFFCARYPELFAWFEVLAGTGSPPAANATLAAPTCPTP